MVYSCVFIKHFNSHKHVLLYMYVHKCSLEDTRDCQNDLKLIALQLHEYYTCAVAVSLFISRRRGKNWLNCSIYKTILLQCSSNFPKSTTSGFISFSIHWHFRQQWLNSKRRTTNSPNLQPKRKTKLIAVVKTTDIVFCK